jgi:hypothetical protein
MEVQVPASEPAQPKLDDGHQPLEGEIHSSPSEGINPGEGPKPSGPDHSPSSAS